MAKNKNRDKSDTVNKVEKTSDTKTDNTKDNEDLEMRLERLEKLHNHGTNNNIYKYLFFITLAVLLTALVYPRVGHVLNRNYDAKNDKQHPVVDNVKTVKNEIHERVVPVIDDETDEYFGSNDDNDMDTGSARNATGEKEWRISTEENGNRGNATTEEKKSAVDNNQKFDTEVKESTFRTKDTEHIESGGHTLKQTGDLMIDEGDGMISLDDDAGDSYDENDDDRTEKVILRELPIDMDGVDDDKEVEQVKLFRTDDVEEVKLTKTTHVDDVNHLTDKDNEKESKTSGKDVKKKKGVNGKAKKVTKGQTTKNENEDMDLADKNLPEEVRNFNASYQKELTPKKIFADGRRIPPTELLAQKEHNSSVRVWLFEEFLSNEECEGLIRVHDKHVQDMSQDNPILCFDSIATLRKHLKNAKKRINVTPRDFTQGTTCVNATFSGQLRDWFKGNWSYSTAFYPGESRFASVFEQRVKQATGLAPENGGKFQITSYPLGIGYKSHTDCTENVSDKRDRVATILVYLDTIEEGGGGETDFPELGIWVRPRKGRAIVWNNMSPVGECEPLSIHSANKVIKGRKVILQRWYYYKSFFSLGKRPPEPPLPVRSPSTPRVSCDEYEHGSCRWYDEWNFEHLIEYERRKYTLV